MLSINAVKGFEYGSGFKGSEMYGSEHNDQFEIKEDKIKTKSNYSKDIDHLVTFNKNGLWIKESTDFGQRIISASSGGENKLKDVTIYKFDKKLIFCIFFLIVFFFLGMLELYCLD